MMPTIRPARTEDLATLLQFEQGVVEAERPLDPCIKTSGVEYYDIQELIDDPECLLLVAEVDKKLVASGYGRIKPAKSYLKHTAYLYLGFMYVDPDYRGQGINQSIIQGLMTWGKEQGIHECRLEVYQDNASAIRAYAKLGFTPHMLEMRLEV